MTNKDDLPERLRLLRGERGLSQLELANLAGIAPAQLSRYELGKSYPRAEIIAKLAAALGVDRRELATKGLERGLSVKLPSRLIDKLVESAHSRTGVPVVDPDDMTDEIRERLERTFDPVEGQTGAPDLIVLAARLQAELAEEQFKNHALTVQLSRLAAMMEDALVELGKFADDHSLDLDQFQIDETEWRQAILNYRYADRWLEQEAKKYEDQLKQAVEARDRSLKDLRERIERRNGEARGRAAEDHAAKEKDE